ncbi:major facilitator superfamily domain-containing protein [Apiospora kogelbergensis]|uniref:major facilitator superfamily domain-containing protein n=1 Tax=Apiospora kogelbergensis TaxID=1337665 RepID=UPI00312FCF29
MGWTADPATGTHWIVPVVGLYLAGTGFNTISQAALNYLVDTSQAYAASAVAANTFLRTCFAVAFPLGVASRRSTAASASGPARASSGASRVCSSPCRLYFTSTGAASGRWASGARAVCTTGRCVGWLVHD